jgi:Rrf2 family protein
MKLSMATTYAVRALVFLARREEQGLASADTIAGATASPRGVVAKALEPLVRARILRSARGPRGGYLLARPARAISLLAVVEAVDGPVHREVPRWTPAVGAGLDARLQRACDAAAEAAREQLRRVSLADLVAEEEETRARAQLPPEAAPAED